MSSPSPTSAGRPLSPSEESRFVPLPSLAGGGSSVRERHFFDAAFAQRGEAGACHTAEDPETGDAAASDGTRSGIVGTTICFAPAAATPDSSLRSPDTHKKNAALRIARGIDKEASWGSTSSIDAPSLFTVASLDDGEYQFLELLSCDPPCKTSPPAEKRNPKAVPGEDKRAHSEILPPNEDLRESHPANTPHAVDDRLFPSRKNPDKFSESRPPNEESSENKSPQTAATLTKLEARLEKIEKCVLPFMKMQDAISGLATFAVSFLVASIPLQYFLSATTFLFHKAMHIVTSQSTAEIHSMIVTMTDKAKEWISRVTANLSKRRSDLVEGFGDQTEEDDVTATNRKEKVPLESTNDTARGTTSSERKTVLSGERAIKMLCAVGTLFLVSYARNRLLRYRTPLKRELADRWCFASDSASFASLTMSEWDLRSPPTVPEWEDNYFCFPTRSTNLVSLRLWEFELSCHTSLGPRQEGLLRDQVPVHMLPNYWLLIAVILSTSVFCAFVVKTKNGIFFATSKRPRILTGMWSEEEHQKFLEGYEKHGNRWSLVSAFVPTRTHTQVKSHGVYWRKIRSPSKMQRSRKSTRSFCYLRSA